MLLPIVAAQGLWVRARTPMVPPAEGPATGTAGDMSGAPVRIAVRIAVVGESTAAGCGVGTHDEGFPGCLARELAMRSHRPVEWEVVGQHAATARRIRHRLLSGLGDDLDAAVLLAGVNDVLTRRTPQQWGDDLAAIVDDLTCRAKQVVVAGIPPFAAFPSLPATLGRYLGMRAGALDEISQRICAEHPQVKWVNSAVIVPAGPEFFARDRFHPSARGYRRWAQVVADHIT
jgi:lysophospholipase L1-like esterase